MSRLRIRACAVWGLLGLWALCLGAASVAQDRGQALAPAQVAYGLHAMLAEDRDNDALRLAYIDALTASGRWFEARSQAEAVLHGSPDRRLSDAALLRLDVMAAARPVRGAIWAEAVPSDNVLMVPDLSVIDTQIGRFNLAPRQAGTGYRVGGRLGLGVVPGLGHLRGHRLNVMVEAERIAYPDHPALSRWRLTPAVEWQKRAARFSMDARLSWARRVFDTGRSNDSAVTISVGSEWIIDPRRSVRVTLSRRWIDSDHQDHLDGTDTRGGVALTYRVTPDLNLSGTATLQRRIARGTHNGFSRAALRIGGAWRVSDLDDLQIGLSVSHSVHDAPVPGFFGALREDSRVDLEFGWHSERVTIAGMGPVIRCSVTQVTSTITLYDTLRTECGFRLEHRF